MFKRVTIVTLVVAAFVLLVAVPALAWNGYRGDYTMTSACARCHGDTPASQRVSSPVERTKHGDRRGSRLPPSACQTARCARLPHRELRSREGDPGPDRDRGTVTSLGPPLGTVDRAPQTEGDAPSRRSDRLFLVPLRRTAGGIAIDGWDANNSAHKVPYGNMADPDLRRLPLALHVHHAAPSPAPRCRTPPTPLIQPQMAIGYPMLGSPAPCSTGGTRVLDDYLNVPTRLVADPNPAATSAGLGSLRPTGSSDGRPRVNSPWQQTGHEGGAAQYPEWATDGLVFGHDGNAHKPAPGHRHWPDGRVPPVPLRRLPHHDGGR